MQCVAIFERYAEKARSDRDHKRLALGTTSQLVRSTDLHHALESRTHGAVGR